MNFELIFQIQLQPIQLIMLFFFNCSRFDPN